MQKSAYPDSVKPGIPKLGSTPTNWKRVKIKDIFKEVSRPAKLVDDERYELVTVRRSRGGVDSRGVLKGSEIKTKTQSYVAKDDFLISKRQIVHGACGIVPEGLDGAIVSNEYSILHPTDLVDLHFLKLLSHLNYFQQTCFHSSVGVHVEKMIFKLDRWFKWDINIPPINYQKKIVATLSVWEKAISLTNQQLDAACKENVALNKKLLTGEKRFPEFNGRWDEVELSSLFNRVTTKNTEHHSNVVTISGQYGLIRQRDFFKKSVASSTLDGYFLLKRGQFAYNKSYSNGYPMGAIKRLNRYDIGVVTTLYICFEISDNKACDSDYFEHLFEAGHLNKGLTQIAHEGGRAHGLLNVKPDDFFRLKVIVPGIEEQKKIASVLSCSVKKITAMREKVVCLKKEKEALIQRLLSGIGQVS